MCQSRLYWEPIRTPISRLNANTKFHVRFSRSWTGLTTPVAITTKSGLVTRDIDILARLASKQLVRVYVSVTSLKNEISRTLEPRASSPARRLNAIRQLSEAVIPAGVLIAPVIPAITDEELESILEAAAKAGATSAAFIPIRLPREVADLFRE